MAKLEIVNTSHSSEEVAIILSDYTTARLVKRTQLFGGYSGSNYLVELDDDDDESSTNYYVLKITNGYSTEHAELMCRTTNHLDKAGYKDACFPIRKKMDQDKQNQQEQNKQQALEFVSTKEQNGEPAFLLTFVNGKQADQVMREKPHLATTVMKSIGGGLARMHDAASGTNEPEAKKFGLRWYETDGGCCDVQDQIDGNILEKILDAKNSKWKDTFLDFGGRTYQLELEALRNEMKLAQDGKIEHGILHGDPFADNVLVNAETGKLSAFIDIEDFCVGPLLFDLACCAIGCCFTEEQNEEGTCSDADGRPLQVLDMSLLAALLDGYGTDRNLSKIEKEHLVAFMRLALLCNCSWRFVKFNGSDAPDDAPEEAKQSFLELQERIIYLHDPKVIQQINKLLDDDDNAL